MRDQEGTEARARRGGRHGGVMSLADHRHCLSSLSVTDGSRLSWSWSPLPSVINGRRRSVIDCHRLSSSSPSVVSVPRLSSSSTYLEAGHEVKTQPEGGAKHVVATGKARNRHATAREPDRGQTWGRARGVQCPPPANQRSICGRRALS